MPPLLLQIFDHRRRRPRVLAVAPLQQLQQLRLLINVCQPAAAGEHSHAHLIPRRHLARTQTQPYQRAKVPDHFILQALQVAPKAQTDSIPGRFVREEQHLGEMVILPPNDVPDL